MCLTSFCLDIPSSPQRAQFCNQADVMILIRATIEPIFSCMLDYRQCHLLPALCDCDVKANLASPPDPFHYWQLFQARVIALLNIALLNTKGLVLHPERMIKLHQKVSLV